MTASASPRVLVTSSQPLLAETVRRALNVRGFDAVTVDWTDPGPGQDGDLTPGLLIAELGDRAAIEEAVEVMARRQASWVVSTTTPDGPAWRSVLEGGATQVLAGSVGLDEVAELLAAQAAMSVPEAELNAVG
jgi:hypothetical protein